MNTFNAVTRNISNQLNQEDGIRASYEFSTDSNYLTNYILKNKERYDLIIIDSTYWGGPITQELINKIIKTTNVFTICNDAYMNDICISNKTMSDSRGKMSITTTGTEKFGGNNNTGNGHSSTTNMWKNLAKASNNGVLKGGTWGSNYLRLNGTDNWVKLGQINLSTQAEFDATIVANSIKDGEADIVGNFDLGGAGIWLSDGFPAFDIYSENRNEYISIKANKKITVGAKTRIVGRYDGRNLYLYVNGNLVARTDK